MEQTMDMVRKEAWVEPEIRTLDVAETSETNNTGGDGGMYMDCSDS